MKVSVVGIGYVGLSSAVLISQKYEVVALDISEEKVDKLNNNISPIEDKDIESFLKEKKLNLTATLNPEEAFLNADYIIIATPTDYNVENNEFDTSSIEKVIDLIKISNTNALIIIKSTIPIGFVKKIRKLKNMENIIFSPEFLREGKALYDNLFPSRIIVGEKSSRAQNFANLLVSCSRKNDVDVLLTSESEAEAIKLFSNSYLAMRVAYFNELDTFSEIFGFNTKEIIQGVELDPRIGKGYNNPSFGYGGYCFPKDTKQLLANFDGVPQSLISAIVDSNENRISFIANQILQKNPSVIGIFRLVMKSGSDNFRSSSIQRVIQVLSKANIEILIYEPKLNLSEYNGFKVCNDFNEFKKISNLIIANRFEEDLSDVIDKVYTRDIFSTDI